MTGTLRSGRTSTGLTKIVLPLTWIVYCEAPTTVARMPSIGRLDARAPRPHARPDRVGEARAEIAEIGLLAAVDVFRDAAREGERVRRARLLQRLEAQQRGAALAQRRAAHRLEQPLGHALDDLEEHAVARAIADCERHAGLLGEAPAGFLDARQRCRPRRRR